MVNSSAILPEDHLKYCCTQRVKTPSKVFGNSTTHLRFLFHKENAVMFFGSFFKSKTKTPQVYSRAYALNYYSILHPHPIFSIWFHFIHLKPSDMVIYVPSLAHSYTDIKRLWSEIGQQVSNMDTQRILK